ncbi:MAG: hypothetical protein CVU87_13390 [Firmicutes bacterium HGW-Firmicutes-12]|jgi:cell division protein FtsL|nr:MAG: hypothetical protein CVU87_13390 [Firmicutes bacterium HGW-Firmicutes-12]
MNCEKCNQIIPEDSKVCPSCDIENDENEKSEQNITAEPLTAPQVTNKQAQKPEIPRQKLEPVLSVGKILLFLVLMAIPVVNLIIVIKWSFNKNINKNLRNLSRSMLIVFGLTVVLYAYLLFIK